MKKSIAKIQVRFRGKTYISRAGLKPLSPFAGWFGMRKVIESHLSCFSWNWSFPLFVITIGLLGGRRKTP